MDRRSRVQSIDDTVPVDPTSKLNHTELDFVLLQTN